MSEPVPVAMAILYQGDRFLMQLRDDFPHIVYPGVWGFFGGHVEPSENPTEAVLRELQEEIGYTASQIQLFECHLENGIKRHIFYGPLTVGLETLVQTEGQDMGWVTADDIRRGDCYSSVLQAARPLGTPHRQVLLRFLEQVAPQLAKS